MPIPFSVIFSPSHMVNMVPAVKVSMIKARPKNVGLEVTPQFLAMIVVPKAWMKPRATVA